MERVAKQQILSDYLTSVDKPDHSKSRLRDELKLSLEETDAVKRLFMDLQ